MYMCTHSYVEPGDCSVSWCGLCAADSEGRFFREGTARILKLEDVSLVVAITMKLWEVLWFTAVTVRTFLLFPMRARV